MILDLKRKAKDFDYEDLPGRFEKTLEFFLDFGLRKTFRPVLDIGADNAFGQRMATNLRYNYFYTEGDLDVEDGWNPLRFQELNTDFKTVTCFEVLEHLMNPALFLQNLKNYIADDALLVVSLPRRLHPFFWSRTQFHEFDEKRTLHLFEATGYEIQDRKSYIQWPDFKVFFKGKNIGRFWIPGIRPMLRLFSGYFLLGLTMRHFYTLTLKKEAT